MAGASRVAPATLPLVLFKVGARGSEGEVVDWVGGAGKGEEMTKFGALQKDGLFLAGESLAAPAAYPLVLFEYDACGSGGGTFLHCRLVTTRHKTPVQGYLVQDSWWNGGSILPRIQAWGVADEVVIPVPIYIDLTTHLRARMGVVSPEL